MFLWDWPNISRGISSMKNSRLSNIYNEVGPSVLIFAQLFGKALQAQTQIAVCNTLLTGVGMYVLGIPGILLLSLFVFLCRCALSLPRCLPW
jgi:predicted PurR-regulated permease PerM